MYLSAALSKDRSEVIVWERKNKKRCTVKYPVPYYFYIQSPKGQYKDIFGSKLTRLEFDNYPSYKSNLDRYKNQGEKIYESDIRAEYKVLAEQYANTQLPNSHITFFDIEVDYDKTRGFSSVEDPYAPINAIALHHYWSGKDIVLVIPPPNLSNITEQELGISEEYPDVQIEIFQNERQLLIRFLEEIEDSDIISGWNSSSFDVPYVYERIKKVLGENQANKLSFPEAKPPQYREVFDKKGNSYMIMETFGRESVDYLEIFKKFQVVDRPSFALEQISEEIVPELKKLDYEGSLYDLYREDFAHFVRYNIRDCEILKAFEDKLGYMRLAIQFAHSSTGLLRDVGGTIKLAELAIINFCHNVADAKVPDSNYDIEDTGEKFTGALVLPPQVGMHDWVASVDVASLYPSAIRTVNISPETIIGQFFDKNKAFVEIENDSDERLFFKFEDGDMEERTASEWRKYMLDKGYSISGYGSVFNLNKQGFIPAILTDWFAQRKNYKKLATQAKAKMAEVEKDSDEYKSHKLDYENYDRLQYVFKIRLNSLYGALGNKFFKFYDVRLAESTTRSGQSVLMHMVKTVAESIDGDYAYPSESTIYSDTDSCYFLTHQENLDGALKVGRAIEKIVNKSFPDFCQRAFLCTDEYKSLISAELDVIASKSIFIKKKYYVMQLAYSDGAPTDKIKLMGVHLKKTTIPKPIAKKLTGFIQDWMKGKEWAEVGAEIVQYRDWIIDEAPIQLIGLPKGVNDFNEKEEQYLAGDTGIRLSGHASAALFYNLCVDQYEDKESFKIRSGMKIKTYYLSKKFGRFKSIALPTDLKHPPEWFKKHFEPLVLREEQAKRLINNPLAVILDAVGVLVPTRKTLLFDELVSY